MGIVAVAFRAAGGGVCGDGVLRCGRAAQVAEWLAGLLDRASLTGQVLRGAELAPPALRRALARGSPGRTLATMIERRNPMAEPYVEAMPS